MGYRPQVEAEAAIFRQAAIGERRALVDHKEMPEPRIKRYALVPQSGEDGVRRFQLARVSSASGSQSAAERLERMEEIAALDRREDGHEPGRADRA